MASQRQLDHGFAPNILAGGVAGGVAAMATSPLDVIKTRLQSSMLYSKVGIWQCVKDALRVEGGRALYKGLSVTLVSVIPCRAVYFTAYTQGKHWFAGEARTPFQVTALSSVFTGIVNVTWANPLYVVRTRQQLKVDSRGRPMLSFWRCTLDTYHSDGWRGFFRGMTASYVGITETVIALVLWEQFKRSLQKDGEEHVSAVTSALAAGSAKLCATTIAYPHEVVRTRLREQPGHDRKFTSFTQTVRLTLHEEGFRGLYRGLMPQLFRVVPNYAIMFFTFEWVMSQLGAEYE